MKNNFRIFLSISFVTLLMGCTANKPAPYEDKSSLVYKKKINKTNVYEHNITSNDAVVDAYNSFAEGNLVQENIISETKLQPLESSTSNIGDSFSKPDYLDHSQQHQNIINSEDSNALLGMNDKDLENAVDQKFNTDNSQGPLKSSKNSSNYKTSTPLALNTLQWPIDGRIISRFGKAGNKINEGINIAAPLGTPVLAAGDGKVVYVGNNIEGYGNLLIIKHDNDIMSAYAHLKEIIVERNTNVKKGESIGSVGQAGNVTQPQLHFSIRKGKKTIDPESAIN